jgi:hypothetical protein
MDHLTRAQFDGIDAAIAEFGNEQTAAAEIRRHVIDAAGYIGECDCRLKFERRRPPSLHWREAPAPSRERGRECSF